MMGGKTKAPRRNEKGPPIVLYELTGTHMPRRINKKGEDGEYVDCAEEGYCHCGCPLEEALLDLMLWKRGTIVSPTADKSEGWRRERLDPRQRGLVLNMWMWTTGLRLDDMYELSDSKVKKNMLGVQVEVFEKKRTAADMVRVQIERLQGRLKELEEKEVKEEDEEDNVVWMENPASTRVKKPIDEEEASDGEDKAKRLKAAVNKGKGKAAKKEKAESSKGKAAKKEKAKKGKGELAKAVEEAGSSKDAEKGPDAEKGQQGEVKSVAATGGAAEQIQGDTAMVIENGPVEVTPMEGIEIVHATKP